MSETPFDSYLWECWDDDGDDGIIQRHPATLADLSDPEIYEHECPPDIRTFLTSERFIGGQVQWDPPVLELFEDIERVGVRRAYLGCGRGVGKSEIGADSNLYGAMQALMMRKPHEVFGLGQGDIIACMNIATSSSQADDIIFNRIWHRVSNSPFFSQLLPHKVTKKSHTRIEFRHASVASKQVIIFSGTSAVASKLGYAIIRAVMDEANFMFDSKLRSLAEDMSRAILGGMQTRFPSTYKYIAISSANALHSFLTRKVSEIAELGAELPPYLRTYVERLLAVPSTFPGIPPTDTIIDVLKARRVRRWQHGAMLGIDAPTYLMRKAQPLDVYLPDLAIPSERFRVLRDIANMANATSIQFFPDADALTELAQKGGRCPIIVPRDHRAILPTHLVPEELREIEWNPEWGNPYPVASWFVPEPGRVYFVGNDYSTKKDATGFAMVHREPDGRIVRDFTVQILAPHGKTVDYRPIRATVRYLRDIRGFRIGNVSLDQHQSGDSIHIYEGWGFEAIVVTHDTKLQHCNALQEMMLVGKFEWGLEDEVFIGEARELQIVNGRRVDHLSQGGRYNSKDVWDAVVNCVTECLADRRSPGTEVEIRSFDPSFAFAVPPSDPSRNYAPVENELHACSGLYVRFDRPDASDYVAMTAAAALPSGRVALALHLVGRASPDELPGFCEHFAHRIDEMNFPSRYSGDFCLGLTVVKTLAWAEVKAQLGPCDAVHIAQNKIELGLDSQARYLQRAAAEGDLLFPMDPSASMERLARTVANYPYVPEAQTWAIRSAYQAVVDAFRGTGRMPAATSAAFRLED